LQKSNLSDREIEGLLATLAHLSSPDHPHNHLACRASRTNAVSLAYPGIGLSDVGYYATGLTMWIDGYFTRSLWPASFLGRRTSIQQFFTRAGPLLRNRVEDERQHHQQSPWPDLFHPVHRWDGGRRFVGVRPENGIDAFRPREGDHSQAQEGYRKSS
jgi:hypothetical protein